MDWQVRKLTGRKAGTRILVVEDEEPVRLLMQHVLLSAGYAVDAVASKAAALEKLDAGAYDLLLTDDRLPDGRGVRIADIAQDKGMAAVVITGYIMQSAAADLDRHQHLMKPVRPAELIAAIDRRLQRADC